VQERTFRWRCRSVEPFFAEPGGEVEPLRLGVFEVVARFAVGCQGIGRAFQVAASTESRQDDEALADQARGAEVDVELEIEVVPVHHTLKRKLTTSPSWNT
jgi:hypothetical protein